MTHRACSKCGAPLSSSPVCLACGPPSGVIAWSADEDGRAVYVLDPLSANLPWPDVRVSSDVFNTLPLHDQFFARAKAFLRAAGALSEKAGEAPEDLDWPAASVCYYLLHLATELFLKACLLRIGRPVKGTHSISTLLGQYRQALPGSKYHFPVRWLFRPDDAADALGVNAPVGIDGNPDQLFRYGVEKNGTPSVNIQIFSPGYFFRSIEQLNERWQAIWSQLASGDGA